MTDHDNQPDPDDADDLDQVAADVAEANKTFHTGGIILNRPPDQQAAADALRAATMNAIEGAAARDQDTVEEARRIEALGTITSRIPPGYMRVAVDIPNSICSAIFAQRIDPMAEITDLDLLDTLAEHITAHLPATIGPSPADLWLDRITQMQTEMWHQAGEVRA